MEKLNDLPNIGRVLAQRLDEIGVNSPAELSTIGSMVAFAKLKARDPEVCLNTLYALEGAIQGIRWHSLSAETKAELKEYYNTVVLEKGTCP